MKKRILGILTVVLALSMVFTMVSCGDKGGGGNTWKITYNANGWTGGGIPGQKTIAKNAASIGAANLPVLTNTASQNFNGWALTATGDPITADYKVDKDITLYARWVAVVAAGGSINITYNANGWTGSLPAATTGTSGTQLTAAQFPASLAHAQGTQTFNGWALTPDGAVLTAAPTPNSDITLYVKWTAASGTPEVTITFTLGSYDGTVAAPAPITIPRGTSLADNERTLPEPPDWDGHEFDGWFQGNSTTPFTEATVVNANITLRAGWDGQAVEVTYFTVTFDYNYAEGPANLDIEVEEDTPIGSQFPETPTRDGYVFSGWYTAGGVQYTAIAPNVSGPVTLLARWTESVLTGDDAFELLYLQNGASAVYQFDIPEGSTLDDYKEITVDYKVNSEALQIWDTDGIGLFHARLLGVYLPSQAISTGDNASYGLPDVKFISRVDYSTPFILDNKSASSVRTGVEPDTWFTVTYDVTGGSAHGDFNTNNLHADATGTVYFALGLACQTTNGGVDRNRAFIQLVKDIKLVPKVDAPEVLAQKPAATYGQFVAYNSPIVLEWRGEPTEENIANPPLPEMPEAPPFDRGPVPDDADLSQVVLGLGSNDDPNAVFTYINSGQVNNQRGWVSFGEAGRANNQISNVASTVTFNNFINAWYLVMETTEKPSGTVTMVWMGDARGWIETAATDTDGSAKDGISTITPVGGDPEADPVVPPTSYIIKIFLPELSQYQSYFEDNKEWAGLALSYWGASGHSVTNLGITKAYLLVAADEVEGSATGISLGLDFVLDTAPADGAAIYDVIVNNDGELVVSAAPGLTDYTWYIDGVKDAATGRNLTIASPSGKYTITLQAKRGGKWVSQAVTITVKE